MKKLILAALLMTGVADAQVYNYFAPGGALSGTATVQSINLAATGYLTGQLPVAYLATGSWGGNAATATALAATPSQCSGAQFATGVTANGAANCATPPSAPNGANPTGTIGLTAVNGSAATFMRSDAAPALSQSIAPTMTGTWTFNPSSGVGIQVNGTGTNNAISVVASSTSNGSYGIGILGGTSSSDSPFNVRNQANSLQFFRIDGDGATVVGSPSTGGAAGIGTLNAQGLYVNGNAVATAASNVATATALAATPSQCTTAQFATGITANGTANCSSTLAGALTISTGGASITGTTTVNGSNVLTLASGGNITTAPTINSNAIAVAANGSFSGTYTGYSSAATATIYYSVAGSTCTLVLEPPFFTTSNATTLTMTGVPSACQPVRQQYVAIPDGTMQDNGGAVYAFNSKGASASISGGTITFNLNNNASGWTNANAKGVAANIAVTYLLN